MRKNRVNQPFFPFIKDNIFSLEIFNSNNTHVKNFETLTASRDVKIRCNFNDFTKTDATFLDLKRRQSSKKLTLYNALFSFKTCFSVKRKFFQRVITIKKTLSFSLLHCALTESQ